jgi:hypothetical protein
VAKLGAMSRKRAGSDTDLEEEEEEEDRKPSAGEVVLSLLGLSFGCRDAKC